MGHKVMKVFDCTDMPDALRRSFYKMFEQGNDTFVDWTIGDSGDDKEDRAIEKWLIENGADAEGYESVLIRYWW